MPVITVTTIGSWQDLVAELRGLAERRGGRLWDVQSGRVKLQRAGIPAVWVYRHDATDEAEVAVEGTHIDVSRVPYDVALRVVVGILNGGAVQVETTGPSGDVVSYEWTVSYEGGEVAGNGPPGVSRAATEVQAWA